MRVRMLTAVSGTRNGAHWPPKGGEIDVPDAEGASLCRNGLAEPVAVVHEPVKATAPAPARRAPAPTRKRAKDEG